MTNVLPSPFCPPFWISPETCDSEVRKLGHHGCRTKLPPRTFEVNTKNGRKNAKRDPKTTRNISKHKPLSCRLRIFHRHLTKRFSPPKVRTNKNQGAAKGQARRRNPTPNFLVPISSRGVGVFHVKGWGPKTSVCPSKKGKPNLLAGYPGVCRDIPGVPQKLEKQVCIKFLAPKIAKRRAAIGIQNPKPRNSLNKKQ